MRKTLILLSLPILLFLPSCASATARTKSVSFYDGETELGSVSGESGTKIVEEDLNKIKNFQIKEHYRFDGWYAKSDFSSAAVSSVTYYPTFDTVYYAKFSAEVTLTINPGDGSFDEGTVTSFTGVSGEALPELPEPKPNGSFDFSYWQYTDSENKDQEFTSKVFPDSNLTLTAVYAPWPTLSFVTNVVGYEIPPYQAKAGAEIDLEKIGIDSSKLDKGENYKFDGWYTSYDSGTGKYSHPFYFRTMPSKDTTLYARFLEKHTIRFESNIDDYKVPPIVEFAGAAIKAPYSNKVEGGTIDSDQFKKENYYFDGWYESEDCSGDPYHFSEMPDKDLTLYAKWTENPTLQMVREVDGAQIDEYDYGQVYPGTWHNLIQDALDLWNDGKTAAGSFYEVNSDDGTRTPVSNPKEFQMPKRNVRIVYAQKSLHKLTVGLIDPFGNSVSSETTEVYASLGSYAVSKDALDEKVKALSSLSGKDYEISYYSLTADLDTGLNKSTAVLFPYAPSADTPMYAVIAKKVSFDVKDGDSAYQVTGYQGEDLPTDPVSVDSSGKYEIFGNPTSYDASKGTIRFYYVQEGNTVLYDFAPQKFTRDLGSSLKEIQATYVPYAD